MELSVDINGEPALAVTRLPEADADSIKSHMLRWHSLYLEEVEEAAGENLLAMHESIHARAEAEGRTLGHRHSLSEAEVDLLREGAAAAMRRRS